MIEADKKFEISYIDASGISCFNRCPARYLFDRLMGLKQPDRNMIAMDFGTDIHLAMPATYNGDEQKALSIFQSSWDRREYGETDEKRNCQRACKMLESAAKLHATNLYNILHIKDLETAHADRISDNEVPFLLDIGAELPAAGRIDVPIRWHSTDEIFADDYKTSGEISGRYFDNFVACPQACLYTLALAQLTGRQVSGLAIEALRVSKTNTETQIKLVYVSTQQIKLFLELAKRTANMMLIYNITKQWPQNNALCASYSSFGQPGRLCEYRALCDADDWRDYVKYYAKTEPFHPLFME